MNSKGHLFISIAKSAFRIGGCLLSYAYNDLAVLAVSFLFAEILGILEELVDKR